MSPKRKPQTSTKQDHPDKKAHYLKKKKTDYVSEPAKAENNKTGKELNLGMKQKNDYSIPKKKNANQELSDDDQKHDQVESTSLALNQLLQQNLN